jgi:phosphate transport system permease protein
MKTTDRLFIFSLKGTAIGISILIAGIFVTMLTRSWHAFEKYGFGFVFNKNWDPVFHEYGALPFIVGTLATSFLALLICIPFSIAISLCLGEFFRKGKLRTLFTSLVELMAGIPSVIYGFWALFYLVPIVREWQIFIDQPPYGVGIFSASLILAIMIVPFSASIGREVIRMVPSGQKEAAYALGATRFEVIKDVIIPSGKSGLIAGLFLALGRALGETMAVTMVIGNSNFLPEGLFSPSNTIASIIANQFNEATDESFISALIGLGLILFAMTAVLNVGGKWVIRKMGKA